jgi:hypothetical protein
MAVKQTLTAVHHAVQTNPRGRLTTSSGIGGETMINRLSRILFGLVVAAGLGIAAVPSAQATASVRQCIGNWVNAPCVAPETQAAPVAPRVFVRVASPRRELHRQKTLAQRKLIRVAARTATVCTGNWVNAACAAP